ncbi:MAG: hypothetical protein AMXMBFR53_33330 [Gemmatimonadota bacterium]
MSPETPTGILRDQHAKILRVADVLEHLLLPGGADAPRDLDAVEECATFIRLYADALHHGKEEDLLFAELHDRGMPIEEGPLAVMLWEHQQGRAHVRALLEALPGARGGDPRAVEAVRDAGLAYVSLIRGHINKENNVLFNWADQMIEAPACRRLCGDYEGVCRRTFDGHTVAQLEDILAGLEERFPDA